MTDLITCSSRSLPANRQVEAARTAMRHNPVNRPRLERLTQVLPDFVATPERLALLTSKYWGAGGVKLSVSFLDNPPQALRARIIAHMNAWSDFANVTFSPVARDGQVRIARVADGYWSYLGTDILHIDRAAATMNLQGFSLDTPESEFLRVVRHETGHTLGFPHEHMRRELVQRLDVDKTIAYFGRTQGWSPAVVRQQVLTPLEESSLLGTEHADQTSIMAYQLPGSITLDGQPIAGGVDIDQSDGLFAGKVYPPLAAPPPPPPTGGTLTAQDLTNLKTAQDWIAAILAEQKP